LSEIGEHLTKLIITVSARCPDCFGIILFLPLFSRHVALV